MKTKSKRLIRGDLDGFATIMTFDGTAHKLMIRKHGLYIPEDSLFDTLRCVVEEQIVYQHKLFADALDKSTLSGSWGFEGLVDEPAGQGESIVSANCAVNEEDIDWKSPTLPRGITYTQREKIDDNT